MSDSFIYGRNSLERIVSCEVGESSLTYFVESPDGVKQLETSYERWLLADEPLGAEFVKLNGELHYKYIGRYATRSLWQRALAQHGRQVSTVWDPKEAAMLTEGFTFYKGMRIDEVSTLSFDIETTGLTHGPDSKVLLISNTFRRNGVVERRLFAYDEYPSQWAMLAEWCNWVRECDPSIILGHNIYSFDLPYMDFCARREGNKLHLGRNKTPVRFDERESKFRKDGSQFYHYYKAHIWGREIVDTLFLSIKYDTGRKYESYALKKIIRQEGLEKEGRQFFDGGLIGKLYTNPVEWAKIKVYAEHDADDSLALFDLMASSFFYLCQSVPKPFQGIINSASGAQINSFLMRSYLQIGHSVPRDTRTEGYEGAISSGNPGIYKNVFKCDVASLYPSIIIDNQIHDAAKDPKGHFLQMVEHFTAERLANKARAKETGDRYYKDLEQAQKILINSSYGMMGAPGLNFNSPINAGRICRIGREILTNALDWAKANGYRIVNADTDSMSIAREKPFSAQDRLDVLAEVNALGSPRIKWEDDGLYLRVAVIKIKNYVLDDGKKITVRGSALKATMKEPALKEFLSHSLDFIIDNNVEAVIDMYDDYAREILNLTDITRWASKKTITETVLNGERTNESRVRESFKGTEYRAGDKIFTYFDEAGAVKLQENWAGDHDVDKLLEKLFKTSCVFEEIIPKARFTNYKLKKNKLALAQLAS
jgi:DNA polymerase I